MEFQEFQIFSPHGEDGITLQLINKLYRDCSQNPLYYVELGAPSAGIVSYTRILRTPVPYIQPVREKDWATWLTRAKEEIVYDRRDLLEPIPGQWSGITLDKYNANPSIHLYKEPDLCSSTMQKYNVPPKVHLLSIRIPVDIPPLLEVFHCDILILETAGKPLDVGGYTRVYTNPTTCIYLREALHSSFF